MCDEKIQICEMCARKSSKLTKHHLIPKTRHRNKKNRKNFTREEVRENLLLLCRSCHSSIHAFLTNKELEYDYNTLTKLMEHPEIKKYVKWAKKQPIGAMKRTAKPKGHK